MPADRRFDRSGLSPADQQILVDFYKRRIVFDEYLRQYAVERVTCPGCGYPTLSERGVYQVCLVCNWEDEGQDDPDADEIRGGPNRNLSLTENRLIIGRRLQQLATNLKGTINLSPPDVLRILREREARLWAFAREHDLFGIDHAGAAHEDYKQLEGDTLVWLIVQ